MSLAHLLADEFAELPIETPGFALASGVDPAFCKRHGLLPVTALGSATLVRCGPEPPDPETLARLTCQIGAVCLLPTDLGDLNRRITEAFRSIAPARADFRAPEEYSCRSLSKGLRATIWLVALLLALTVAVAFWPGLFFAGLLGLASCLTVLSSGLRCLAVLSTIRRERPVDQAWDEDILPTITLFIPLHREADILQRLLPRLHAIDYPRSHVDACLIVEEDDAQTCDALKAADLPRWLRVIVVPASHLRTKPRAMNYAMDFARGSIVGIYDAEDAPAPDQLKRVARRFSTAPPEVVCLQGILDFYNPRHNWLSRCFTVDYATWFRLILPGFRRLGLALPLGGTTLFFRREALDALGAWDAHNVTEDADLGIRLARMGYRTDLIETVTEEEANSAIWPWIKQRSRWLKGYAMTWAVHMRDPVRLWRDLGPWRFLGVQVLFLGTILQFLLGPLIWSLLLISFGWTGPFETALASFALTAVTITMLISEGVLLATSAIAVWGRQHRHLIPWLPLMHIYYALGTLAVVKALVELVTKPFYWDKTDHGAFH